MPSSGRRLLLREQGISPPAGGEFLSQRWERNQRIAGDAAGANFVRHVGLPPGPHYGGYPFEQAVHFRRAKSEWVSKFILAPLGAWLCGKLRPVRFHNRAWVCRTNGTGSVDGGSPKGLPYPIPANFLKTRRGGDDSPYQGEMSSAARQRG